MHRLRSKALGEAPDTSYIADAGIQPELLRDEVEFSTLGEQSPDGGPCARQAVRVLHLRAQTLSKAQLLADVPSRSPPRSRVGLL